jgi:hypothetical protein
VLNSNPIQYLAPLYAYLNTAPELEVTALYMSVVSREEIRRSGVFRTSVRISQGKLRA